MYYVLQETCFT